MIGEATYIACRHKQQLLPSSKQELPAWIYVRGKVQFKSMCCLEGIECGPCSDIKRTFIREIIIYTTNVHKGTHTQTSELFFSSSSNYAVTTIAVLFALLVINS
jgi:hypothetical protein